MTPETVRPITELRVHGVSGAPAEETLDRAIIGRVAGDHEAGFFRPRPEYGPATTHGPGGALLEAYRWGNLTAGAAARAFWLLLLPFSLANLPIWMLPPSTGFGRRVAQGVCRVFALTLSATFILAMVGVFLDLIAWQCAGSECAAGRPWLSWWFSGFFAPTGRRLALAALGPAAVVGVLWLLARRTWARYESFTGTQQPQADGLATRGFWNGRAQVGRLRGLHTATMVAVIAAVLSYQLVQHDRATQAYAGIDLGGLAPSAITSAGQAIFWASIGILALCALLVLVPAFVDRTSRSRVADVLGDVVLWASLWLVVAALAYGLVPRAAWSTAGPLPGYATTVTRLFAAQTILMALMVIVVLFQRHRAKGVVAESTERAAGPFFYGFGAPVVASIGLGLGAAFSAAISYRVADLLDGDAVPSPAHFADPAVQNHLQPPISYQWAAFGFVLMIIIVAVTALWVVAVTRPRLRRRARAQTDEDFGELGAAARTRRRRRAESIDRMIATAALTDHLAGVILIAWIVLVAVGVAAVALALREIGPVHLADSGSRTAWFLSVVTNLGTYLISAAAVLLVLLGIQTYRSQRVRSTVGIVWDLATFWPRAAHPLAPPCYAERVVPELAHRAAWLATQQGGVILSGHSQGSMLVVATVLQLPPEALPHTAVLTYGSPLRRLYARAFPAYFSDAFLAETAAGLTGPSGPPRWINFWRRTDPIGGAVGIGDIRLPDPPSFGPLPGDRIPPPAAGHGAFQQTPEFAAAVTQLSAALTTPAAAAPTPVP